MKKVYFVAILDFILFDDNKEDDEYNVERVRLVREKTNTVYSDVLEFIFVELPKFKKTEEDMEKYNKSILEYSNVRSAVNCAREEGLEKGINKVIQKCLQKNMPIEDIVFLTGYSKEQIINYKTKN